jgi:hypothetical protein
MRAAEPTAAAATAAARVVLDFRDMQWLTPVTPAQHTKRIMQDVENGAPKHATTTHAQQTPPVQAKMQWRTLQHEEEWRDGCLICLSTQDTCSATYAGA